MYVVKLYDKSAVCQHIGRFDDLKASEEAAKRGLNYSNVAIVYEGEMPVKLYDNGEYKDGFPLGVGSY
ncbi:hypothetical protein CU633_00620 [Bacillus sp. V3-13]|uniref:hypothetical protein n=1 Tax=Bacillus sp. V3-13 TaxID=2053728 RepID=UPI000C787040|nr:hypothetical protein [Bacillus sp. V3-13]PLR79273.1 hypothetical protein CU633_00620 [Bacillus sp. V3-13]